MCTGAFADLRNTPSISQRLEHVTSPLLFRQPFRFFDCTLCKLCSLYSQLGCQLTVTEYLNAVAGLFNQTSCLQQLCINDSTLCELVQIGNVYDRVFLCKDVVETSFGIRLVSGI